MSDPSSAYDLLRSAVHLSTSSLPLRSKLDQMVQAISKTLKSDRCFLIAPEKVHDSGLFSRLASEGKALWADETKPFNGEGLPESQDLLSPAFALLPLSDETSFQGFLYIGFSKSRIFSPEEMDLLLLLAKEMGATLHHAFLHQESDQTIQELTSLHEMGKTIISTLKLEELFSLIVANGLRMLKARGGVLRVEDKKTGELKVRSSAADYYLNPIDEKLAKRVFFTRTPLSFNHSNGERPSLSVLCVPLLSKEGCFGTLSFYDKEGDPSGFDEKDCQLLLTMTDQMSCAIENARAHLEISALAQDHERKVHQLSTLYDLNRSLLTTVHLEEILHIILTATTVGGGLGFNRAMLFLLNEKEHALEGVMAVGPDNPEEAGNVWTALSLKKERLSDLMEKLPSSYRNPSALNLMVKEIRISLDQDQCILSRTVLEARPFNIKFPLSGENWIQALCENGCQLSTEVGCTVGEQLGRNAKAYSFATVPVWGKGRVIGVLLVDNLYNQNPITDEDLTLLSMFSNQAGLAIENATLYRNLEEVHQELKTAQSHLVHHEKMFALGEMSATIAHEIRNPLVAIGGFARRLYRAVPEDAPERRYTETIISEVSRLEKILTDLLSYTADQSLTFKECDLREIIDESLSEVSRRHPNGEIRVVKEYAKDLPRVKGDPHQLKQVFFNLLNNSYQAMKGSGTLSIRIRLVSKNGSAFVRVELEDTGLGIDPENLHNIFNPFYTTKESSLGLGLPIIHKIVTSHQGQIEVDNHPGQGVKFIVTFPVLEMQK